MVINDIYSKKMEKIKSLFSFVAVAMFMSLQCSAQVTDISGKDNVIYLENSIGAPGEQTTLSLRINNTVTLRGFQCDIYLPEGISFVMNGINPAAQLSTARTTVDKTDYFNSAIQEDGALRVICASTKGYDFNGSSGEVAIIPVSIESGKELKNYSVYVKGGNISDPSGTNYVTDNVESSLEVVSSVYDEDYALWISPFDMTEDREDIAIMMTNKVEVKSIDFDIILPSEYVTKEAYDLKSINTRYYEAEITDNHDGTLHFSCNGKSSRTFSISDCANVMNLCLYTTDFDDNPVIEDGVQRLELKNIEIKDKDDNIHRAVPYAASFFIGDLSSFKTIPALYGKFDEDGIEALNNAFADNKYVCVYDLTNATSILSTAAITVGNENALIMLAEGMNIANEHNVVIDGVCSNLELKDGCAFNSPENFDVSSASYDRVFLNQWQSICLPFDSDVPAGVTAEQLIAVDLNELVFSFSKVTTLSANTPYIIRSSNNTALFTDITTAVIKTPDVMEITVNSGVEEAVFTGVYESVLSTVLTPSYDVLFFGADGNFYYANSSTVAIADFLPFRSFIMIPAGKCSSGAKAIVRHDDGTTSVCSITDIKDIVGGYDLLGRHLQNVQRGTIYIDGDGRKVIQH